MSKQIIIFSVLGLILIIGVVVGVWIVRYYSADVRGKVTARETILSGPSRIAAYNYFFNLCSAIQGHERALDALTNELDQTTLEKDRSRVISNITGLTSQRARSIAQYNVDARKDYTIGQFRDLSLPYQLPFIEYKKGVYTSCGSY